MSRVYLRRVIITKAGYGREGIYKGRYYGAEWWHWRSDEEEYEFNAFGNPYLHRTIDGRVDRADALESAKQRLAWEQEQEEKFSMG